MSIRVHAAWSAGAAILLTASRFAPLAVLARRLNPHALGLYAYAQWMVDIGFLVASFGFNGAASRYLAEYRSRPGLARREFQAIDAIGQPLDFDQCLEQARRILQS